MALPRCGSSPGPSRGKDSALFALSWHTSRRRQYAGHAREHRALRRIVWVGRATGWVLIALAILNVPQIGALTGLAGGFRVIMFSGTWGSGHRMGCRTGTIPPFF